MNKYFNFQEIMKSFKPNHNYRAYDNRLCVAYNAWLSIIIVITTRNYGNCDVLQFAAA